MRAPDLRPTEARWLAKAAVQGVLSYVPRGRELNHYLQRHVSKRPPRSERDFDWHAQMGVEHLQALDRVRPGVDLVDDTIRRFATDGDRLERVLGVRLRRPDESPIGTVEELVTRFGISYLAQAGFEIAWNDPATPTTEDLAELHGIPIAPEFDRFTVTDLGTKYTHLVARPAL